MKSVILKYMCVALTAGACTSESELPEVRVAGKLRDIMHDHDITAKAHLDTLTSKGLYALGVADSLEGEITVLNSNVYLSMVRDNVAEVDVATDVDAALLVYTYVSNWNEVSPGRDISDIIALNAYLAELQQSMDISGPMPFLLKGEVNALHYHILSNPGQHASHDELKRTAYRDVMKNSSAEIIGFYSKEHQGVFTHHDTHIHMHFVSEDKKRSGHIDSLTIGDNIQLYIPEL